MRVIPTGRRMRMRMRMRVVRVVVPCSAVHGIALADPPVSARDAIPVASRAAVVAPHARVVKAGVVHVLDRSAAHARVLAGQGHAVLAAPPYNHIGGQIGGHSVGFAVVAEVEGHAIHWLLAGFRVWGAGGLGGRGRLEGVRMVDGVRWLG